MSASRQISTARLSALLFAVVVLLGLAAYSIGLRLSLPPDQESDPPPLVLDRQFDEPALQADSSVAELLALAEKEIQSLLTRWPESPSSHHVKANRDFQIGKMQEAETSWKQALELDPLYPDALFGLANIAFEAGNYQEAINICEGLQRTNPGNPRVPLLLADAYLHEAKPELASLTLEQHIASEPASVKALEMLGSAYAKNQDHEQAMLCFRKALEFVPDSKDAHYGLGQALVRLGQREAAQVHLQKFRELAKAAGSSNSSEAKSFVERSRAAHIAAQTLVDAGLVYRKQGDATAFETNLIMALQLQPEVVVWLKELRDYYLQENQPAPAIPVLEELVKLEPDQLEHLLVLGGACAEVGRTDCAMQAFQSAIDMAPEDPRCNQAKSILRQLAAEQ